MRTIPLQVRYLPAAAEICDVFSEEFVEHKYDTWNLPVLQTALVIVDAWNCHYLKSFQERATQIAREKIKPILDACRELGITVIHAPSPDDAKRYPQWVGNLPLFKLKEDSDSKAVAVPNKSVWPPEHFRKREGLYAQFAKPRGRIAEVWQKMALTRRIIPEIEPREGEYVVATGKELEEVCGCRGIVHLLYAGFAANWCVLFRDYGLRDRTLNGYNVILLRDCTTAVENAYTLEKKSMTEFAVMEAEEVFRVATATSDDLMKAYHTTFAPD